MAHNYDAVILGAGAAGLMCAIEAGKRADLIVLNSNPLEDIHNIRTVEYVIAKGVMYKTAELWHSVGFRP